MKVLQIGSLDMKAGGPSYSVCMQMRGLKECGVDSVCLMPQCPEEDIIDSSLSYSLFPPPVFNFMGFEYIPSLDDSISICSNVDVMHIQGVWSFFFHRAAKYAYTHDIPYVIAPRGALYSMAIKKKYLKKKIAWYTYQKRDLEHSTCLQVTCEDEMIELRSLGLKNPIAVIPNPYDMRQIPIEKYCEDNVFRIGFIGRLEKRKHVERIIYALYELKNSYKLNNIEVLIIGGDVKIYESFLRNEAKRLGVADKVKFTGFIRGIEKDNAIKKCHIFAFPSDFENWGNVVADVLARGIPAITTKGMPWEILTKEKCGWWITNKQSILTQTLYEAYLCGYEKLSDMGRRGRNVVEKNYSVEIIGEKLKSLYFWILNGGEKPGFVYF